MTELKIISITESSDLNDLRQMLDEEEGRKAKTFKFDIHRNQFITGRAILKQELAASLNLSIDKLNIKYSAFNKPYIDKNPIYFNVSHSGQKVLIVLSDEGPVGVDVEKINPTIDVEQLVLRYFTEFEAEEVLKGRDLIKRADAFFYTWTKKEAFIKAHGSGLQIPLSSFEVHAFMEEANLKQIKFGTEKHSDWWIQNIEMQNSYMAALCTNFRSSQLNITESIL